MMIISIFLIPLVVLILIGAVVSVSATGLTSSPDDQLGDRSINEADYCCPSELVMLP